MNTGICDPEPIHHLHTQHFMIFHWGESQCPRSDQFLLIAQVFIRLTEIFHYKHHNDPYEAYAMLVPTKQSLNVFILDI